jgi:FkbM family methyltransferase
VLTADTGRRVRVGALEIAVADRQPTFWDAVERGTWEPLTLATLRAFCRPGVRFVDCGAWVGPTTLVAAGAGAEVIAVEADPAALEQLRANLAANPGLAGRVTVLPRALSVEAGEVRMGAGRKPGDSMSSLLFAEADAHWTAQALTPAELARLIGTDRPRLVKVDIEGGEYAIVPHLVPALNAPQSAVMLSLHPKILRQVHGDEGVLAATRQVLGAFAGWQAAVASEGAWTEVHNPLEEAALARAARKSSDWLFLRDWPEAVELPRL